MHIAYTLLKFLASLEAKAELSTLFINAQNGWVMQLIFNALNHLQPTMPVHCDNLMVVVIANHSVKKQHLHLI